MRFPLSPVELTLQVEAVRGADGKIGWHVLSVAESVNLDEAPIRGYY